MYSLLSTSVTVGFNLTSSPIFWVFSICLVGVFLLFVYTMIRQYLFNRSCAKMQAAIKVGDKVRTFNGILGKVVKINNTLEGKVVVIETGEGKNIGYLSLDIKAIYEIYSDGLDDVGKTKSKKVKLSK